MTVEAFRYSDLTPDGQSFTESFLSSYDFDMDMLRSICKSLNLQSSGNKNQLAYQISQSVHPLRDSMILQQLVMRTRTAFAVAYMDTKPYPQLEDTELLINERGRSQWYGPIARQDDPNAMWYVKPIFLEVTQLKEANTWDGTSKAG